MRVSFTEHSRNKVVQQEQSRTEATEATHYNSKIDCWLLTKKVKKGNTALTQDMAARAGSPHRGEYETINSNNNAM